MTDDKQDPSVVVLNNVIGWLAELDYPGVGTQMQRLSSLTSGLTAMKAELEEAKKERDQAVSENDTGTDALLAAIDAHLALEDEIMACETFDVFLVLQARLRLQREADVAATKVTVERALDRFKQGRALSKPKPHDETRGRE